MATRESPRGDGAGECLLQNVDGVFPKASSPAGEPPGAARKSPSKGSKNQGGRKRIQPWAMTQSFFHFIPRHMSCTAGGDARKVRAREDRRMSRPERTGPKTR